MNLFLGLLRLALVGASFTRLETYDKNNRCVELPYCAVLWLNRNWNDSAGGLSRDAVKPSSCPSSIFQVRNWP
jgi:hypothetical protein